MMKQKLLVVQVAALGYDLLVAQRGAAWRGGTFRSAASGFPAVTCSAQASFRTAASATAHGMIANGRYFRDLCKPLFWEQSSRLVEGPRIWERFRAEGGTVALMFWQQILGESADILISPQPIHKHGGGMIQACYSRPADLYDWLRAHVGSGFRLEHYWGPLASRKSSDWIAHATCALLRDAARAPDLCLTYLPVLDYDLQRFGPAHPRSAAAVTALFEELELLGGACAAAGYDMLVFGDYAMGAVKEGAVFPNRLLRNEGLLAFRTVRGRSYPDFCGSRAFAMVDHEIAHVFTADAAAREAAARVLAALPGVELVADRAAQKALGVAHANSGELVLVARDGAWFAYPWWKDAGEEPDYARHIDIHNKPGYDPCELFFGWPPISVSRDTSRIRGSHGRSGPGREIAWYASFPLAGDPASLLDIALAVQKRLSNIAA